MSLYISGVPLPKLGPVFLRVEPSGAVVEHDDNTGEDIIVGQAIDISDHGRLIDAGALTYLMGMDEHFSPLEAMYLMGLIADAPTIIPASKGGA